MKRFSTILTVTAALTFFAGPGGATSPFTAEDELRIQRVWQADISPDGRWVAYTIRSTRPATDPAGADYRELHVASTRGGENRAYISGAVSVLDPQWSPDGSAIGFRMKRGDGAKTQVWRIPFGGGESAAVTDSPTNVLFFRWHPEGTHVLYTATTPPTAREKKLKKKGYGFRFVEENLKHRNVYQLETGSREAVRLTDDITVWDFEIAPSGSGLFLRTTPLNLIDHRYAFPQIEYLEFGSEKRKLVVDPPGKLGYFAISPDSKRLAYVAARSQSDHNVSQLYVIDLPAGAPRDITPANLRGQVSWVAWRDRHSVLFRADEGVWNSLNSMPHEGGERRLLLDARETGVVIEPPSSSRDFEQLAIIGSGPDVPRDLFAWTPDRPLRRLTTLNPWLAERRLGRREIIRYEARDGLEIEGLLHFPVDYREGRRYPLIVVVHGGPEAHYANRWNTSYSRPIEVLAGRGYAVFLPNYRSSTGYGPDVAATTLGDPAGKEFDDIADGIDYLVATGIVDPDRVGLGGGSYGGYAAAWFSSFYTDKVRAVCMFVGISNLVSKRGTTDIPYEELFVHSGKPLEEMWQLSLERSPIYHAAQSRTAVLIYGGTADTRVHPAQSLEYYRRLKMNNHPAVRLVQYPGEEHGNAKQPGKIDVLYRTLGWYDWYVRDAKPIDGPMPPLDLGDHYGIGLDNATPGTARNEDAVEANSP